MAHVQARLGERVRGLRLDQRMTQEELAERSDLSYKFIGEVERGRANPSLDTLDRLATGLGVELAQLFAPQQPSPYSSHISERLALRDVRRSLRALVARLPRDRAPRRTRSRKR